MRSKRAPARQRGSWVKSDSPKEKKPERNDALEFFGRTKRRGLALEYAISETPQCCDKCCSGVSNLVSQRAMIDTSSGQKSAEYTRSKKSGAMKCAEGLRKKEKYEVEASNDGSLRGSLLCLQQVA